MVGIFPVSYVEVVPENEINTLRFGLFFRKNTDMELAQMEKYFIFLKKGPTPPA